MEGKTLDIGETYSLRDPASGRTFIGFGLTREEALVDALHQYNESQALSLRIQYVVHQFANGGEF